VKKIANLIKATLERFLESDGCSTGHRLVRDITLVR
jgi:hypothetical protein